jgi:glucan phosphoethanolaminetransferase (alkaline phosphatase superfamily)
MQNEGLLLKKPRWVTGFLLGVILLLIAPNFLASTPLAPTSQLIYLETVFFGICYWLFWLALFKKFSISFALALIPATWWFASVYLRWNHLTPINSSFYGMLVDTHWLELYEFSLVYGREFIFSLIGVWAILIVASVYSARYKLSWQHRSRNWILVFVPITWTLLIWQFNKIEFEVENTGKQEFLKAKEARQGWDKLSNVYPVDLLFAAYAHQQEKLALGRAREKLKQSLPEKITYDTNRQINRIVLVIGESANARRWQLYGFERPTTPKLSSRNDLIILRDVVSPSIATRNSVPLLISKNPYFKASLKGDNIVEEKSSLSLVEIFNQIGYQTYWLSNQAPFGKQDSAIAIYGEAAKTKRFVNPSSFNQPGTYDEALLPVFQNSLKRAKNSFIVLHTMGSHFHYTHRYPPSFEYFSPTLPKDKGKHEAGQDYKLLVSNAYDNSTRYTDHMLNTVISMLEQDQVPTALLYIADHGEDVFEPNCKESDFSRFSKASYQVPAFLWVNQAGYRKNSLAVRRISVRADQPLMTKHVFDMLIDLAAIGEGQTGVGAGDWTSQTWRAGKRWVGLDHNRSIDFDLAKLESACRIVDYGSIISKK